MNRTLVTAVIYFSLQGLVAGAAIDAYVERERQFATEALLQVDIKKLSNIPVTPSI